MTVRQIFSKIDNYIENRQIFMLVNSNCTKLANFEDFLNMLRGRFLWTQCISMVQMKCWLHNVRMVAFATSTQQAWEEVTTAAE